MHKINKRLSVKLTDSGKPKLISTPQSNRVTASIGKKANLEQETANLGFGGATGGASGLSISGIGASQRNNLDLILTGIINDKQSHIMRMMYRDIYNYDPVGGSAVDMTATLPFSDFSLTGCPDKELEVYVSSIERLSLKTQNSYIHANELVFGEFVATAVFSSKDKVFTDMVPYALEQCDMQYLPFISMEPSITVRPDGELKQFLNSTEPEIIQLKKHIPEDLLRNMSQGEFVLDPLTTIYMARTTIDRSEPTSYFRRLIPIYLLEKTLTRGTLVEATKRQRAFLHAMVGNEDWEPTEEELGAVVEMLQKADLDPLGPVIATRDGIQLSEARSGGDFWKSTDIYDITTSLKLRALQISESFLSGDSTYATAEINLSVYMENLKYNRASYTQKLFYNKLFPVIAAVNGFIDSDKEQTKRSTVHHKVKDGSKYRIPKVHWHKNLDPVSDTQTIEMLNILSEKGIPVPLRLWAAAGGMSLESIEEDLDKDIDIRKQFAEYNQELEKAAQELGGGDEYDEFASVRKKRLNKANANLFAPTGSVVPRSIFSRDYGDASEVFERTVTGKRRHVYRQKEANRRINEIIAKATANLSDKSHYANTVRKARRIGNKIL